ncbi:MAG: EAL domain-containing protein [Betaproteobacteria bacterium]|nr:EAL domain-containing protein [Betaproteobacteria bacterium]
MLFPPAARPSNRGSFAPLLARLERVLSEARAAGASVAVLLVHSGGVERLDAQRGFHAGDLLAGSIEGLLRVKALRQNDIVEPLSRSEFACILRSLPSTGMAILAAHRVQSTLGAPVKLGEAAAAVDPSVGIAIFPDHGTDVATLLQRAKAAQQAALLKRDRYAVYCESEGAPASEQDQYETRLRLALHNNALSLALQPQLSLRTGRIVGAEALLRWNDEVLGAVPAHRTVAVAESCGLMDTLTFWVITGAVQRCAQFVQIDPNFTVSVNVSPANLKEPDLPIYIDRALRTWGVGGANLIVEITETAMLIDQTAASEALNALKSRGVRLSIDDFGTGYSSMYYLAQLPLDELKVDLMFIRDMLEVPVHAKIARSLIELAHNLDLTVVAEGVEDEATLEELRHLGCDSVQGYHVGMPSPAEQLLATLRGDANCRPAHARQ